jgi:AcrR family transcriptional regulator
VTAAPLTPEQILIAAEDVLRRHGPAKANVVDIARALGVSHGTVYRHFPSKQALREAVTRRWLDHFHHELAPVIDAREWLHVLFRLKRERARMDPELFATYMALLEEQSEVVDEHVAWLQTRLTELTGDEATARTILLATTRWHHPAHASEWVDPQAEGDLDRLLDLLLPQTAGPATS